MTEEQTDKPKPELKKVYCSFVGTEVPSKALNNNCDATIVDGRCTVCEISPQVALGVPVGYIIANITSPGRK